MSLTKVTAVTYLSVISIAILPRIQRGKCTKCRKAPLLWSSAAILANDWNYMKRKLSFAIRDGKPLGADSGIFKERISKVRLCPEINILCKTKWLIQILVQLALIFHWKKRLYGSSCIWHWLMLKDIEAFTVTSGLKNMITLFCSIFTSYICFMTKVKHFCLLLLKGFNFYWKSILIL